MARVGILGGTFNPPHLAHLVCASEAAAQLRHGAIHAGYSGLEHKEFAFALALILDELGRHLRDLDEELRAAVITQCRVMLG